MVGHNEECLLVAPLDGLHKLLHDVVLRSTRVVIEEYATTTTCFQQRSQEAEDSEATVNEDEIGLVVSVP